MIELLATLIVLVVVACSLEIHQSRPPATVTPASGCAGSHGGLAGSGALDHRTH